MRVIAGEYRGRSIKAPKGLSTRPTTDRVKESCISSLETACHGFEGRYVLDAFSGSGSLGIELISRGAQFCEFFENDRVSYSVLQDNLKSLGIDESRYRLGKNDVFRSFKRDYKFTIVILDPPYKTELNRIVSLIENLCEHNVLEDTFYVLYEHGSQSDSICEKHMNELKCDHVFGKTYGDTVVDIMKYWKKNSKG